METIFNNYPEIITPEETAEILRISKSEVLISLETGELKGVKFGGTWRIHKRNIMDLFDLKPQQEKSTNLNDKKIGEFVMQTMNKLLGSNRIPVEEINRLKDLDYSKKVFGLPYPMLKDCKPDEIETKSNINGYARYWKFLFNDRYLITNHWVDRNKDRFVTWANKF